MGLKLITPSDYGIFEDEKQKKLIWEKCYLVNESTGEVVSKYITPKFKDWDYDDYVNDFHYSDFKFPPVRFLEAMSAFEPDEMEEPEHSIAEIKFDGHRCLLYIGERTNRAFSKRISKVTGWFSENTDQLPHIRDLALPELEGTVLDGEIKWGKDSKEAQGVMGALPSTAIQNQWKKGKWTYLECFDILYYKGVNVQKMPLLKRKHYLCKAVMEILEKYSIDYIKLVDIYARVRDKKALEGLPIGNIVYVDSFESLYEQKTKRGEEGLIIKDINGIYEQGKVSRAFLKWKKNSTWDCVIMGLTEPVREYTGKKLAEGKMDEWPYWEDSEGNQKIEPVTKPYAMGWCGGIRFGVWKPFNEDDYKEFTVQQITKGMRKGYFVDIKGMPHKLVEVGIAKGLTEEIMEDLKKNADKYVKEHRVIEIMAQEVIDKEKGSLRHPRYCSWRDDKDHTECTWDKHIREDAK